MESMQNPPFDLATFFPFVCQPSEFTEADATGSFAVHHDLAT